MQVLKWLAVVVLSAVVGFVASCFRPNWTGATASDYGDVDVSFTDLAVISMTAATVALAALAVILAVAGVVGYQTIRSEASEAAKKTAAQVAKKTASETASEAALSETNRILPSMVENLLRGDPMALQMFRQSSTGIEGSAETFEEGLDPSDQADR